MHFCSVEPESEQEVHLEKERRRPRWRRAVKQAEVVAEVDDRWKEAGEGFQMLERRKHQPQMQQAVVEVEEESLKDLAKVMALVETHQDGRQRHGGIMRRQVLDGEKEMR